MSEALSELLDVLGLTEMPYGITYSDTAPAEGFIPAAGPALSVELEQAGRVSWPQVFENFSCVLGKLWLARRKGQAAYFEAARYGWPGGSFYLGFHKPQLEGIARYVSIGTPGTPMHGERYLCSPASAQAFFTRVDPRPAPARFCVMEPMTRFTEDQPPELVAFFARGEVLVGLANLAAFVTDDVEVVATPFGAGCSFLVSWPLHYLAKGQLRAVLGCGDPSARKFMKPDEMTFTVPYALYTQFLARWRESFLTTDTWGVVRKKIARSREAWGEGK